MNTEEENEKEKKSLFCKHNVLKVLSCEKCSIEDTLDALTERVTALEIKVKELEYNTKIRNL